MAQPAAVPTAAQSAAISAVAALDPAERAEAAAAIQNLLPTTDAAKVKLWRALIIGTIILAVVCVGGAIAFALIGRDASPWIVVIASIGTGLIGLFAKSPTSDS